MDSRASIDFAYTTRPSWDIGHIQPALETLLTDFPPRGPALDVGCGTGVVGIALLDLGLDVLGIDISPNAIEQANARLRNRSHEKNSIEFRVGDALRPSLLNQRFRTVVDSGFYHLFDPDTREQFERDLETTLTENGRYYVLGFAFDSPIPGAPRAVTPDALRRVFSAERGWRALT